MKIVIVLLVAFNLLSCQTNEDSLEQVARFMPEDKYFKSGIVSLHFIIETRPIPDVNDVFDRMIKDKQLPVNAKGCADGIFIGESPYDAYDYKHRVKLTIRDDKIIAVDYNEIKRHGIGKQEDEAYCEEMSVTGTTPAEAYPVLEQQLVAKQNMMDVDAVSGATYSLYRFRYAVTVALMNATVASRSK